MASRLKLSRSTARARLASAGSRHLDRPLDNRARPLDPNARAVFRDRHDTQVDARSQPPIEPHFLVAPMASLFERAVIHKVESDRLLDLVGETVGHEDDRNVSLVDLDLRGGTGYTRGSERCSIRQARSILICHSG